MRADERKKSSKSRCGRGSRVIGQQKVSVNRGLSAKIPDFPKGLAAVLYRRPHFFISAPCATDVQAEISAKATALRRGKTAENLK